jgi:RimJ/RimL family protein N-acetyltransferase
MSKIQAGEPERQTDQCPIINMAGKKVLLGPPSRELVELSVRWDNDFALTTFSGDPLRPKTKETVEAEYGRYSRGEQDSWAGFAIYEASTLRLIGVTDLRHIDGVHRTAEFGICIGEKDCWSKGYGTEATCLMLDYGFSVLGLHNIMLHTYSFNERAIRAYQRAGFRVIGRRREARRVAGRAYDVIYMDCLATEFQSPLPPVVASPE